MAKNPATTPAPAPPVAAADPYRFRVKELPVTVRVGPPGRGTNPAVKQLLALEPYAGEFDARFFPAPAVPDTVTDPAAREKAGKEAARKLANRLSSVIRSVKKRNPGRAFKAVQVTFNGVPGVSVYRLADEPVAPPAPAVPAVPTPPPVPPVPAT